MTLTVWLASATGADGSTSGVVTTTSYAGTSEVRSTVFHRRPEPGTTSVLERYTVSARVRDTRTGASLVEEEMRRYLPLAGRGRPDDTAFVAITRYERVTDIGEILLRRVDTQRTSFAFFARSGGTHPFDGLDRRRTVEVPDVPGLVWSPAPLVYERNDIARTEQTSIARGASGPLDGAISERVESDGRVHRSASDSLAFEKLDQTSRGGGLFSDLSPQRSISYELAPPVERGDRYTTRVVTRTLRSNGRDVQNVVQTVTEADDWFPDGRILPLESDVVTTSDDDGEIMPERCGPGRAGRRARVVHERRSRTRIDGRNEMETIDAYGPAGRSTCRIEATRVDRFDLASGRPQSRLETVTVLVPAS